jgi:hypothetical protein
MVETGTAPEKGGELRRLEPALSSVNNTLCCVFAGGKRVGKMRLNQISEVGVCGCTGM